MPDKNGAVQTSTKTGFEFIARSMAIIFLAALLLPITANAGEERFVDSSEYRNMNFKKGIINDYTEMVKDENLDWVWVSPDVTLSRYVIRVGKVENKSDVRVKSLAQSTRTTFKEIFDDMPPIWEDWTASADLCIYEVRYAGPDGQPPQAGGRHGQPGVGIEMVLFDSRNQAIARFRHFKYRGTLLEGAVEEVAEDLARFIRKVPPKEIPYIGPDNLYN